MMVILSQLDISKHFHKLHRLPVAFENTSKNEVTSLLQSHLHCLACVPIPAYDVARVA